MTDELAEVDLDGLDPDEIRGKWRDVPRDEGGLNPDEVRRQPWEKHRLLREVYRHYPEFRQLFIDTGIHVLTNTYEWYPDDTSAEPDEKGVYPPDMSRPQKETVSLSLFDLTEGLNELTLRRRQAFYLNVILDLLQKEAGAIMGISTVTVGQYVDQATIYLAKRQFGEDE